MERARLGRDANFSLVATHAHRVCETTNLFTDWGVYIGEDVM